MRCAVLLLGACDVEFHVRCHVWPSTFTFRSNRNCGDGDQRRPRLSREVVDLSALTVDLEANAWRG